MIGTLAWMTLRALLNRRRTLLLVLLGLLVVAIVGIFQLSDPEPDEALDVTRRLLSDLAIGVLLPLVAVIIGTAVIGSELDDGTIVYLLARPVPRWRIVLVKLVVAWVVVALLVAPATLIAGLIGQDDPALAMGFAAAAIAGALEYTAIFVALSLITSRALIIGLAYVVVWEGIVAGLFAGTRPLSVRQHVLALAEALGGSEAAGIAEVALEVAIVAMALVILAAAVLAVRRLQTVELRGETA
ncbi:MAG TPA: ABC transporter permease subunit [Candidatus Limnocylindria bacterium]|nr:ABC transporter permease subunit [Candidatus Limnocylindria bacterium]